jgi:hypothetical protein
MALSIFIKDDGSVTVSVDGMIVGCIKSLSLELDEDRHPMPHISVTMYSLSTLSDEKIRRMLMNYRLALQQHPLVHVVDYNDSVPALQAVDLDKEKP